MPEPLPAGSPAGSPVASPVYRFGRFELRSTERVLLQQGHALVLGSRALQVLLVLVARAGDLLTKDELLQAAWPGLVVEEANVHVAVSQLRKVLGKAAIATVAGLGYRFVMPLLPLLPILQASAPPSDPAHRPRLPTPRTAFVGRAAELQAAAQQLRRTRLLTIVGMGGMGKTRLALKLAETLQPNFADGAFFVDLAPVQDGSAVPGAVLRALGLPAAVGSTAAATTNALVAHLLGLQCLLVLDNCEHQVAAVRALLDALTAPTAPTNLRAGATPVEGTARTTVLATSRQALDVPGESCLALRPLQLSADEGPFAASVGATTTTVFACASDAQQLFVQRVQADTPGFEFDPASAPLVADICRRLDGIPLALELAAARMKMLSLQQLQGLLRQRFELLSSTAPSAARGTPADPPAHSPRQQTLQDVLHWSWDHLAAPEQTLALAVAVCSGGFDLDTAVALMGSEQAPANPVAVLDSLADLAARALIHVSHGGEMARYGMLETVRDYLLDRASKACASDLPAACPRQRHLVHFSALALQAEQAKVTDNDAARWAARLDAERDNLMAALAFCHLHGSVVQGLQLVVSLKNFWFASGWLDQGLRAAQAALARVPPETPTLLAARTQRLAAQLCLFMSRGDEGAVHARLALAQSQALGDAAGAAAALCFAGRIAVKSEDTHSGEKLLHEALRRARAAGDLAVVGEALNALAFAAIERDDLAAAEDHFGQALLASQQRASALGSVIETLNLAWVAVMKAVMKVGSPPHRAGELERARQLLLSVWHTLRTRPHRYVAQELVDVCASFALHVASLGTGPKKGLGKGLGKGQQSVPTQSPAWHQEAALLQAASHAQRLALHLPLTAKQAARRAAEAAAVRAALGEAGFDAAAADGAQHTHEQTLARLGGWLQAGPVCEASLLDEGQALLGKVAGKPQPAKTSRRQFQKSV